MVLLVLVVLAGSVGFVAAALGPDSGGTANRSPAAIGAGASGSPPTALGATGPAGASGFGPGGSDPASATAPGSSARPGGSGPATMPGGAPLPSLPTIPTASPGAGSPPPGGVATTVVAMPIVPVVDFWSTRTALSRVELTKALHGDSTIFRTVVVPAVDRDAIAATLGGRIGASVRIAATVDEIRAQVRAGALGLLRAADVTPAVRALGIDDRQLFGNDRITDVADWPLLVDVQEPADRSWDQGASWTIAAAGDILLDRGVARQVKVLKKGVDFPFDGGTAEITGFTCCSGLGHRVPTYRRTGARGAIRSLIGGADLSMANLESPVDDQFRYHGSGTVFTGDPKLLDGLKDVGLDYASLANNHIGNAGPDGILETIQGLDARGIGHAGAGKDLAAALVPATYEIKGVRVAVLGCDAITPVYWARANKVGSNGCQAKTMIPAIRAAKQTHDLVIIYPHWGIEYTMGPARSQARLAHQWIAAGADLILGNHPHWTQAIEQIDGSLVFYALGNLVFDQMWQENTMEGLIVELTWERTTLRQVRLRPTLVIDQAQPNLLDPVGDGQRVLKRIRDASRGLLPY